MEDESDGRAMRGVEEIEPAVHFGRRAEVSEEEWTVLAAPAAACMRYALPLVRMPASRADWVGTRGETGGGSRRLRFSVAPNPIPPLMGRWGCDLYSPFACPTAS